MTPTRKKRLILVMMVAVGVAVATAIFLTAVRENINYFKTPTEVATGQFNANSTIRLGGMVKNGSVKRAKDSLKVRFVVTDFKKDVTVEYQGILPDLFREGQGVVTIGKMGKEDIFVAEEVLAKHDENYMPPEAADALHQARSNGESE
ncbi:MAG: cytochrome c maturation protein CcmE [Marinicella sp.]|nr:cytochrome c maturation protein CcmE [Xanthomonadales bacterium]